MTIDEAIRHCEEVADGCSGTECEADHRQLAEWLMELKERRQDQDTISRAAAVETVRVRCARIPTMAIRAMQGIKDLPAIQPKRGRWELDDDPHDGDCRYSYCGTVIEAMHERHHGLLNSLTGGKWWTFYRYCPNCGAKMEKGEQDEAD
jgi:hypothetical protein